VVVCTPSIYTRELRKEGERENNNFAWNGNTPTLNTKIKKLKHVRETRKNT